MENSITIWEYIDQKIAFLKEQERIGTSRNYAKTKCRLSQYCSRKDLLFEEITEEFVIGFNAYLEKAGVQKATISFYNRVFRSIYNQAAREGIVKNIHPFDVVYTKVVTKLAPLSTSTVRTKDRGTIALDDMSRDELMDRCRILQQRYNKLVTRIANLARV